MATHLFSPRARAEHYRTLAGMMSDEGVHRVLLDMAREYDEAAAREFGAPGADEPDAPSPAPAPPLRSFS